MKKLVFLLVCLFSLQNIAKADNDKPIQVNQLPQAAQQFVQKHFSGQKITLAKKGSDLFDKSYEVIFTNGNKVEFDKQGNWKDIECKSGSVPTNIIPVGIATHVKANYPNTSIVKIDKDKKDYEVKLSNRVELKFDLKYNLIDLEN